MAKNPAAAPKKGRGKNDSEADKIMAKMESGLVNKRYATAEMLDPSLGLSAGKVASKAKAKKSR